MNGSRQIIIGRLKTRSNLVRRIIIVLAFTAVIIGLQSYIHYSILTPLIRTAELNFNYLVDERQNKTLSLHVADAMSELRTISGDSGWQSELDEIQSEFQGFLNAPAEGVDVAINRVRELRNKTAADREVINQIIVDLETLGDWHRDYYGDVIAKLISPGIFYWPTSMLFDVLYPESLVDAMQYNRGLYLVIIGEVSAGQAILGELRTRLPDSPLRARVLYTEGRLQYGMGRYEQSMEIVQQSVRMDPHYSIAKRFLEYQLSKGPDEEVEEEDEDVQRVGTASAGGATLF